MSGFRLGRVAGVEIFVNWSLIIIFLLVTFGLATGLFPSYHPDWSPALTWTTALVAAALFFLSVLLHEMSHALVGRAKGIEIKRITLFMFGGMAHLEHEPRAWRAELWMAIAGPLTSLGLGVLFFLLGGLAASGVEVDPSEPQRALAALSPLATLLFWLGPVNVGLALFNLLPGFPLDGGRVLRAIIWGATGDLHRATRWTAAMGQGIAWLFIVSGVAMMLGLRVPFLGRGLSSGLWMALIGWFLNNAARASYQRLLIQETLEHVPVSRLMQRSFASVDPDLTLDRLVDEYIVRSDQNGFPVIDAESGRLVGLISLDDLRKVSREVWGRTPVRSVMTTVDALPPVSPDADAALALLELAQRKAEQLPVVEGGEVRGILRREDILRWLSLYGHRGLAR